MSLCIADFSFVCTLQEDKRKFTFIHKGHRYEFPRLLILARSSVYLSSVENADACRLADAIGNTGNHPPENIPPPDDMDPTNPTYTFDTTDIFPDFDPTTFHIFLQMLSRFCIYKPESIDVTRIKQIWRISDYFDIPTLLLNEDDLIHKIRMQCMSSFEGIENEFDFAIRYNWKKLRTVCIGSIRAKTADLGGLLDDMKDTEIMALLNTLVTAERRKSGLDVPDDDDMDGDWEGVRWTTPPNEEIDEKANEDMKNTEDDDDDDEIDLEDTTLARDTTMGEVELKE
jgi:hypothetical protein